MQSACQAHRCRAQTSSLAGMPQGSVSSEYAIAAKSAKRCFPWRLSRHIATQYAWPLLGTIVSFAMVSLLLAVFDDLPDFSGMGVPVGTTLLYFAARMPKTLLTILPFSSLLAICFMTMVLGKNNELTAIRSAGISLLSVATPILVIALMLCGVSLLLSEVISPAAIRYTAYVQERYLDDKKSSGNAESLSYYNARYERDWFFSEFSREKPCRGIIVRTLGENGRTAELINAAEGSYDTQQRAWIFRNGTRQPFSYLEDGTPIPGEKSRFETFTAEFHEKPRDIFLQSQSCEELPIIGLWRVNTRSDAVSPRTARLVKAMLAWRFTSPFSALIATLLGFSLTLTTGRKTAIRGFILAVALFMAYHLLAQFALLLGKNGVVEPFIAGSLPTILALVGAFVLAYRRQ